METNKCKRYVTEICLKIAVFGITNLVMILVRAVKLEMKRPSETG